MQQRLPTFISDYKRGKLNLSIKDLKLSECVNSDLETQQQIFAKHIKSPETKISVKEILVPKYMGLITCISGVFGMIYCLPYLYSSKLVDVVGAGLPFIAGSILTIGGLYIYSKNYEQKCGEQCATVNRPDFL